MTDTPVSTGLAAVAAEVKDVEAKLAALESAPSPAPATPSAPSPAPTPAPTVAAPTTPAPAVAQTMIISNEPIPTPPDAVPVPPVVTAPIHSPALDAAAAAEQARQTKLENEKNAFYQAILKARTQGVPPPIVAQPVAPHIVTQTELEKAAGAAAVAKAAEAQGRRIIPPTALPTDGTMTPVFRPPEYVPDQRKGQGNVSGTPLS
jgi:hypothetical protein